MKNITHINKSLFIESAGSLNKRKAFVNHDGKKILLADVEKIAENFWIRTVYDENYIVVYSRGDMSNQIPLYIEAAYNIKNKSIVNLSDNKTRELLEYMLICKKGFNLATVLQYINNYPLLLVSEDSEEELVRYLTCDNMEIPRGEIIKYILKNYPELEKYMNYTDILSVMEYKKIVKSFGNNVLSFHRMPQIIDLSPAEMNRLQSIDELNEVTRDVEQELGVSKKPSIKVKVRKK